MYPLGRVPTTATSFWYSLKLSYDHGFHLSQQLEATQHPARVDERHKRGATRGNGAMRAGGSGGREASA
jgi:hypothetical protein